MKSFITLLLSALFCVTSFSQSSNLPRKYRSVFLGGGIRTLNTKPGTLTFSYTDESPSMDHLESVVTVEDKYNKFGIQLGYAFGRYKGLSHSILFDIAFGEHQGGLFTYSLGWNFPVDVANNPLIIRGALFAGFGNFGFDAGSILNNAGYIEINGKQYTDSELFVKLTSQTGVYGPEVDFNYLIGENFSVFANFQYNLGGGNSKPKVKFSPNKNDSSESTELAIDAENLFVDYNGENITSLPYDLSGLRWTLGVAYLWNRD